MRLLVVEDERDLAEAIARGLRREGWAVDVARDGGSALEKAEISDLRPRAARPAASGGARR